LSNSTFSHKFKSRTDESHIISKGRRERTNLRGVNVNPLFFFKPEQLVDRRKLRPYFNKFRGAFGPKGGNQFVSTGAGRSKPTVVHGICKKLTDLGTNRRTNVINRAELNRTAGTTSTLLGQSPVQVRSSFRRNTKEFESKEREIFRSADTTEDWVFDSRVASQVELAITHRRHNPKFDEDLKISPTVPSEEDYTMFG